METNPQHPAPTSGGEQDRQSLTQPLPGGPGPAATPSGPKGDNPATSGAAEPTPDPINPASPANTGTTPGSNADLG